MSTMTIGIDIGGTKIAGIMCDAGGVLSGWQTQLTPGHAGANAVLEAAILLAKTLIDQAAANNQKVTAVGVGAAGQIDPKPGVVVGANENLPGWRGTCIASMIEAALNLPVVVDNDVNAMALAEHALGAAKDYQHVLFVTAGTGIGGALLINGDLWRGAHFSAGEIGYLFAGVEGSMPTTIEEVASGPALEKRYRDRSGTDLRLHEIADRAQSGDETAREVITYGARQLAQVLAPVLCLIDPEVLIVGGGVPQVSMWWETFVGAVGDVSYGAVARIPVLPAELGIKAGAIGAALLAARSQHQKEKV